MQAFMFAAVNDNTLFYSFYDDCKIFRFVRFYKNIRILK